MKKINQTIIEKGRGNCMQAAIASMLELELIAVPHFLLYGHLWWNVYWYFLKSLGYDVRYVNIHSRREKKTLKKEHLPSRKDLINGCIYATVPSRTFGKKVLHAVLINSKGRVIHDPNPNKKWLNENIIETNQIMGWDEMTHHKG